jgi:hypothetical protein
MLKLALNLALPAAGILLAALAQLALTTVWPRIKIVHSGYVSIDSYFVVLLALGLCFVAGRWAQRNAPTIAGAACAVVAPLAWLGLLLSSMVGVGPITWFRPIVLFVIFTAMTPLIGVALGWFLSAARQGRLARAHS